MKKIALFLVLVSLTLSACTTKKTSTLNQSTNATPIPVVEKKLEWKDLSRANPKISLKYPSTATVQDNNNPNALLDLSFDLSDKKGNEDLNLTVQKTKITKPDLEDLETDLYNGKDQTLGSIKYTCYFRTNRYIKDQYTFLNKRYTGNAPDEGYRFDCTSQLATNYLHFKYQNDTTDLSYYRSREKLLTDMLSSIQ